MNDAKRFRHVAGVIGRNEPDEIRTLIELLRRGTDDSPTIDQQRVAIDAHMGAKPAGYVAVGSAYGEPIPLHHHAGYCIEAVERSVMTQARREGFKGTIHERLRQLEWTVEPFYLEPRE